MLDFRRARSSFLTAAGAFALLAVAWLASTPTRSAAQSGDIRLRCSVTENGETAPGMVSFNEGEFLPCGRAITLPSGIAEVRLKLPGAIDEPTVTLPVRPTGREAIVSADFQTGVLEVRVDVAGEASTGMATIMRNGESIGRIGSGVGTHISVGTYDVVVRHRATERRFDGIAVGRNERRTVIASF